MVTLSDIVQSGTEFRDRLAMLAADSAFSEAERNGFDLLHLFYADRLASFQIAPRHGEESDLYDDPKRWSDEGTRVARDAVPSAPATQQPIYDAANRGGDALEAVTGIARSAGFLDMLARSASSVRGSLLPKEVGDG